MTANSLPTLPDDCVFDVLQYLSAEDLARVSSTCHAWHRLSKKNSLWQRLCLERWRTWPPPPPFSQYYNRRQIDRMLNGVTGDSLQTEPSYPPEMLPDLRAPGQWYTTPLPPYDMDSWKNVYRERHQKDAIVRKLLEEMVEDSRNRMRHIDGIASIGMVHARDVLENIIAGQNGEERDLTRIFYARKTLKRLRRGWVLDQWRAYRSSQQDFPVWQGCALMAMFSDHEMELSDIDRQFQDLADEFLAQSPVPSHDHSLSVPSPTVALPNSFDRYSPGSFSTHDFGLSPAPLGGARQNLVSSEHRQDKLRREMVVEQYSRHYNAQAERLKHLIQFFTGDKGFKGNTDNYYDPFNSFIDKVLSRKVGIPISLCIVFSELAHRVGITGVDLMGFPQHFMIRFRPAAPMTMEHTSSPLPEAEDFVATPPAPPTYYLDLFHPPHRLLSTEEYENYFSSLNIPQPANVYRDLPTPPLEIFLRCLRNIILAFEQRGGAGRVRSSNEPLLWYHTTFGIAPKRRMGDLSAMAQISEQFLARGRRIY
ncbi:Transglutaminase-like superfamily-domain-containing protein [Dissophora ornata]|nr:Transglutaminase-like superfamily-domain-containing protein [Dissophora ornata]